MLELIESQGKQYAKVSDLKLWDKNPRDVKDKDLERLKRQISKLGVYKPVLVTPEGEVIGGNQRFKALQQLGQDKIWVSVVNPENEAQKIEYALSDNDHIGIYNSTQVLDLILPVENQIDLRDYTINLRPSLSLSDFIDLAQPVTEDQAPPLPEEPVTKQGDLWVLGDHRLYCGDSTNPESYERLLQGGAVDLLFTDPPYGVSYGDKNAFLNAVGRGNCIQDNIENDTGTPEEMQGIWTKAFTNARAHLKKGGVYYCCAPQGGQLLYLLTKSLFEAGLQVKQTIIWAKNNIVLGRSDYKYQHEPIIYGWKEQGHKFYGETGETTIWNIPKPQASVLHPTMKPIALVARAVKNSSREGETILDTFAGSGSTLIACEQLKRKARLIELDESYCDVIVTRWEKYTGQKAHKET